MVIIVTFTLVGITVCFYCLMALHHFLFGTPLTEAAPQALFATLTGYAVGLLLIYSNVRRRYS